MLIFCNFFDLTAISYKHLKPLAYFQIKIQFSCIDRTSIDEIDIRKLMFIYNAMCSILILGNALEKMFFNDQTIWRND